jgi:hypothetical protein
MSLHPINETPMPQVHTIPGKKALTANLNIATDEGRRHLALIIDLFNFTIVRGLHLLKKGVSATKLAWTRALEQAHNHRLHPDVWPDLGVLVSTPLEPYRPYPSFTGRRDIAQGNLRDLILATATYYSNLYDEKLLAHGLDYQPDALEDLGKKITSERAAITSERAAAVSAKTLQKDRQTATSMVAEDYMGLVGGRGVSAPSGADLDDPNILQALDALGDYASSYTSKLYYNICTICIIIISTNISRIWYDTNIYLLLQFYM